MTVFVDPDVPAPTAATGHLRRRLGRSHESDLGEGVRRLHAGAARRSLPALRPGACPRAHRQGGDGETARLVEASLHPLPQVEGTGLQVIREAGFCAEGTHYDFPKPRTSFPVGHLTTGIAYAFPWHRDVWYSAPAQQINWWLPVLDVREDNAMRFDPQRFDQAVANSSGQFDYYQINTARLNTASQNSDEQQARPAALSYTPVDELVVVPPPGAVMLFSGAQLHASIPNTSGRARFSVDFRTVDVADLNAGRGAPLVDVYCTGTAIRDFRRVADDAPFDEDVVTRLFGAPPPGSTLVFTPPTSGGKRKLTHPLSTRRRGTTARSDNSGRD